MNFGRPERALRRARCASVVVRDELCDGVLQEYGAVPDVFEEFHAIRVTR